MSNYYGQLPPQFNNKYNRNKIVDGYQKFSTTNTPFLNNQILLNNPTFHGSIRDPNFYNRINMEKLEQAKRIKSVADLNMTGEQLANYIICPIKVETADKKQYDQMLNEKQSMYITHKTVTRKKDGKDEKEYIAVIPQMLSDWYDKRKNTPYKNILKNENYEKEFKKKEDLIVHKITQLDKDKMKLLNEYEVLTRMLEKHDGELKLIYSASEETKHAEQFNYVQKYKNRIKYDPKNYEDLKQFYKKTQRKYKKEERRIDDMIELLLASEDISEQEIEKIKQLSGDADEDGSDNTIETDDVEKMLKKGEKDLERQLEKEIEKELEKEIEKELTSQSDKNIKKIKVSKTKISESKESKTKIGHVDDDEMAKYKNRK